jgi:hypothetical protein
MPAADCSCRADPLRGSPGIFIPWKVHVIQLICYNLPKIAGESLITSKLRQRLQELSPDLNVRLPNVESKARQFLEYSQGGAHLHFTPHGLSHISAVEASYDWLLTDSDFQHFNGAEIFCLLVATLFHDALMVPKKLGEESQSRESHAVAARSFLLKHQDLIGLTLHEVDVIADIIRGHGIDNFETIPNRVVLGSQIVEPRKLAACLSLADIAHADSSRAPEIVFRYLDMEEDSSRHWKRHMQISGITRKDNALLMSALTFSDEGDLAVEEYRVAIEKQLAIVKPYFDTVLQPITSVDLNAKRLESPLDQTLRFQTNTAGVLKVLIEGVYDREDVFIRELVQNSMDACLVRRLKLERRNAPYDPKILLTFFSRGKRVNAFRIDDNGVGMDLNDLKDTVLWIGSSIASKADIAELVQHSSSRNLIATFGIGLLSCFKTSNRIIVRTAKERALPLSFVLTSVSEAVKPEKSEDTGIGTTIIVELPEDGIDLDAAETVSYYFRQVHHIQINLLEMEWSAELESYTRDQLFRVSRSEATPVRPVAYVPPNPAIDIGIEDDDFRGHLWLDAEDALTVVDTKGTLDVLNEGVFVANEPSVDWLSPQMHFLSGYLNFSAKSLNLPAGRDRVIKDDTFRRKSAQLNGRAASIIEELVQRSKAGGTKREYAALLLTHIFNTLDEDAHAKFFKSIDDLHVQIYKSDRTSPLAQLVRDSSSEIYVHYAKGRWVEDLVQFDGKQLYHRQDDLTDLQAAIVSQQGKTVLSATRNDVSQSEHRLLEVSLLIGYLNAANIRVVDLNSTIIIEGKQRSKPVPEAIRKRILHSVKFVEIGELPNKISWLVGSEVWINIAHPLVAKVYSQMQQRPEDERILILFEIFANVASYALDSAFRNVCAALEIAEEFRY